MPAANATTQWARLLFASIAAAGVEDVVVSPGSRNTPFLVAAEREKRLRLHSVVDERAAAFFALGRARVTGRPSAVLCTSGTAAAHYLPAVVEASLARVPLLVITADRPLELQDAGAAQTIDQVKLYGDFVRRFYELGAADESRSALDGLRRLAAQAVHASQWPDPGPVHLNVRARKPLEPAGPTSDEELALERLVDALVDAPVLRDATPVAEPDPGAIADVAAELNAKPRGLVVAGPQPLHASAYAERVVALSERLGYPLCAEATSQIRFGTPAEPMSFDAFDLVLRHARVDDAQIVLQVGGTPASVAWERAGFGDAMRVAIAPHGFPLHADVVLRGDPARVLDALLAAVGQRPQPSAFATRLLEENLRTQHAVAEAIDGAEELREAGVIRQVLACVPAGSLLMAGNSLPVRELDWYGPAGAASVGVLHQRGANGIDGMIAGAAGAASAAAEHVTLLTGDVSILHDLGSLAVASDAKLVIVAINNRGGRIFEQLPIARAGEPAVLDRIVTAHDWSFEHAAAMFGIDYRRAATRPALGHALDAAYGREGCSLVEAVVPEHSAAEDLQRILEASR